MGKHAIMIVALVAVSVGVTRNQAASRRAEVDDRSTHQHEILARQAAHTGYAEAAHLLTAGADPDTLGPLVGRTAEAAYATEVTVEAGAPRVVRVRVEGRAGGDVRHVVEAVFREATDGGEGSDGWAERVPPYLRYAVFSGDDLRFTALPRVLSADPAINADVHTNGDLDLGLSLGATLGGRVADGFGTYRGDLHSVPVLSDPADAFRPPANPEGEGTLRRGEAVPAPTLDVASMADRATRTTRGELRLLGRVELGTREAPVVHYVRGDLVLVDAQIEGYGVFLVEGAVLWESTLTGALEALAGAPESRVGVYAEGPIVFNGVGEVAGQFVSGASVTFSGAATLYGSVAARGAVNLPVAPTIRFVPPSPSLTDGLPHDPPEGMRLVSMREWEGGA